jgi:hypothetical protein
MSNNYRKKGGIIGRLTVQDKTNLLLCIATLADTKNTLKDHSVLCVFPVIKQVLASVELCLKTLTELQQKCIPDPEFRAIANQLSKQGVVLTRSRTIFPIQGDGNGQKSQ